MIDVEPAAIKLIRQESFDRIFFFAKCLHMRFLSRLCRPHKYALLPGGGSSFAKDILGTHDGFLEKVRYLLLVELIYDGDTMVFL